jgi:hypothetical protein
VVFFEGRNEGPKNNSALRAKVCAKTLGQQELVMTQMDDNLKKNIVNEHFCPKRQAIPQKARRFAPTDKIYRCVLYSSMGRVELAPHEKNRFYIAATTCQPIGRTSSADGGPGPRERKERQGSMPKTATGSPQHWRA